MQARGGRSRSPRLLPPITVDFDSNRVSSGHLSPTPFKSPTSSALPGAKSWSYYHRSCVATPYCGSAKKRGKDNNMKYSRLPQRIPVTTFPSSKDPDEEFVTDFLDHNRSYLESYVMNYVPLQEIERWSFEKISGNCTLNRRDKPVNTMSRSGITTSKKNAFMELVSNLSDDPSEQKVLFEMTRSVTSTIGVDAYRVYKLLPDNPNFVQYFVYNETQPELRPQHLVRADADQAKLVLGVANGGQCCRVSKGDDRFPDAPLELFHSFGLDTKIANHVLYQPILNSASETIYVVEMWRISQKFSDSEVETSSNVMVWGSLALHFCNLYLDKKRERNMSDFLLDVVKAIFEEMVSLDQLIKRILEFAQRLVNADRASLFLVDYRNFELVSTVFDLKFEPGQARDVEKKEIRMPINRGIAGHVALSGETMNIPDAYSDYRFNREVDEATGYKTISILCMPIKVQGKVIGVVQMVNKRNDDSFHHEDEVAFEIFSTFFGLALHHARLYDRIMRKEQKYRVALEVLSYHNTCRENEVQAILEDPDKLDINLNDFYLDPYKFNHFEKCKAVITMFNDLFDLSKFDITTVTRFILTVKKNYRTVPYHNFDHGWSVAHSMYVILKNDIRKRFNYEMRLALFVACLCHDLDHRGYTNKYMSETASPLAAMYTTSTLEHHHFNITVTILQQDGHNIFSHISSEEYKEVLGFIRHCILATDLAAFFPNLAKMKELYDDITDSKFTWTNNTHRELAMAISMTSADLSASAKPWYIQIKTVKVIFEEFYDQGDKERAAGRTPIPMMDRNKPDEQPESQVGFLSQICIPCYKTLYQILPRTKPMYVMALKNLHNWKAKASRINRKLENNGEETEDSEIEDVPEGVLLDGEPDILEENSESETEEGPESTAAVVTEVFTQTDDVEKILRTDEREVLRGIDGEKGAWEEEDRIESEKIGGRLSKDIEGVTWIDEEGVVVRPNGMLKGFKSNGALRKK